MTYSRLYLVNEEEISIVQNELSEYLKQDLSPLIKTNKDGLHYLNFKHTKIGIRRIELFNNFIHATKIHKFGLRKMK